jgi:hypothetical protein
MHEVATKTKITRSILPSRFFVCHVEKIERIV